MEHVGMPGDPPDCVRCGVCCFSDLPTYVRVDGEDHARLGADAERLTVFHGNRCYMRMEDGHCAALAIEPSTARYLCTVYETRPGTCRDLERGSPACEGERALKGARPLAALRLARERDDAPRSASGGRPGPGAR